MCYENEISFLIYGRTWWKMYYSFRLLNTLEEYGLIYGVNKIYSNYDCIVYIFSLQLL